MVIGPEISVDAAIQAGQYHPFCLARKQLGPAPYFEEVGHLVDAGDSLLADEQLLATLATAHQALGVVDGMTHTEVRLTSRGPVIIEVNARLGGDLIPYLGQQALGVQPGRIAAEVATGRAPSTDATQHGCAGIRFLYPPEDCQVLEVAVPEPGAVHGLLEARPMVPPGAEVRLPPNAHLGRFAYVLAIGPTRETCEAALEQAAALVKLRYQPLGAAQRLGGRPW
jgi:biotin carboxylase